MLPTKNNKYNFRVILQKNNKGPLCNFSNKSNKKQFQFFLMLIYLTVDF